MLYIIFATTDPTELVVALRANHVIAPSFLFLDYQTALWAVHDRAVVQTLKELLHLLVKFLFAVFLNVVDRIFSACLQTSN